MNELPAGLTARSIRLSDAPAITAQMAAYTTPLLGFAKNNPEDVENYLRAPNIDPARDGWLVHDGEELVGSATAVAHNQGERVSVDVCAQDRAVASWLLDRVIARAHEQAAEAGCRQVTISLSMLREDSLLPDLATDRGLVLETSIQRLEIRHTPPTQASPVPDGVEIRRGAFDDASRRAAYQVIAATFADQPRAQPPAYDEWLASRELRSTFDWSQLTTLVLDGRPVAVRECSDMFVKAENSGYIGRLCVLAEARGRGLAKFLLREQFALDAAAGLSGTILHVDTSNPTAALDLYLGVGMRPRVVSDIWQRTSPVA